MFPYYIAVPAPDYKRPSMDITDGSAETLDEIKVVLTNSLAQAIRDVNRYGPCKDYTWKNFYDDSFAEYYMENEPWSYKVFMDGKWTTFGDDTDCQIFKDAVAMLLQKY